MSYSHDPALTGIDLCQRVQPNTWLQWYYTFTISMVTIPLAVLYSFNMFYLQTYSKQHAFIAVCVAIPTVACSKLTSRQTITVAATVCRLLNYGNMAMHSAVVTHWTFDHKWQLSFVPYCRRFLRSAPTAPGGRHQ